MTKHIALWLLLIRVHLNSTFIKTLPHVPLPQWKTAILGNAKCHVTEAAALWCHSLLRSTEYGPLRMFSLVNT